MKKKVFSAIFLLAIMLMLCYANEPLKKLDFKEVLHPKVQPDQYEVQYPVAESFEEYIARTAGRLHADISYDFTEVPEPHGISRLTKQVKLLEKEIEYCTNVQKIENKEIFKVEKKKLDRFFGLDVSASLYPGKNFIQNSTAVVVETEEGQLGQALPGWPDKNILHNVNQVVAFGEEMEKKGIHFLNFIVPGKYFENAGYSDNSQRAKDVLIDQLNEQNIDYVDVYKILQEEGKTDQEIFYNSDHHWKPTTGIRANAILGEELNKRYGCHIDTSLFKAENYIPEEYGKVFMGSLGRKATEVYAEPDEFTLYYPIYDSNLTVSINGEVNTGSIAETLFNREEFQYSTPNYYAVYGYGDRALIQTKNNTLHDGSSLLLIKTSYADCMIPYLANAVDEFTAIDPRVFTGSISKVIEEVQPDVVVFVCGIMYYEEPLNPDGIFDFR